MHHVVYETTNLINGKKYIGKHSTINLNDGYKGSGKILKHAFKLYGKENFNTTIIKIFKTEHEAFEYEKELITDDIINSKNYYNLALGGGGNSRGHKGKSHSEETKLLISKSQRGIPQSKTSNEKRSKTMKGKIPYTYSYNVTHPDGTITVVHNLAEFCRINKLNSSHMCQIAKGNGKFHKGFSCEKIKGNN